MGVSGCGKSTLAKALATELDWPMIEGDAYHPAENIAKMSAGIALNDADRAPWLLRLNEALRAHPQAVLACSALKKIYRDTLCQHLSQTAFVHVHGDFDVLLTRMQSRSDHFMPSALLRSQFDALEIPTADELCCTVDICDSTHQQLRQAQAFLRRSPAVSPQFTS